MRDARYETGSALILVVVLVSLLAIVGVMFLMAARIDKMSTSAIAENKTLNLAVDTVIAKISQELVLDVPGMPNQEYYDYPDPNNAWLANLEPSESGGNYYWRQISDIYNKLGSYVWGLPAEIIDDYQKPAYIGDSNGYTGDVNDLHPADADGDGVSDSVWVELDNITSSKGRPIYAAVRVIDNGAMLNVNTAYKFDPCEPNLVDGSSQMQINLMGLSWRPWDVYDVNDETELLNERTNYLVSGIDPNDLDEYKENVVWRYNKPNGAYTPFDISDELEVRYRFLVNQKDIDTRLEPWGGEFRKNTLRTPAENLGDWFIRAYDDGMLDPNYAYRHIATTYNMDRIINPVGGKMVNINNPADANELYDALVASIDPNINPDMDIDIWTHSQIKNRFAQLTANVVDFTDDDTEVTVFKPGDPDIWPAYYGFDAQPFITEIGFIISDLPEAGDNYYAVELYNPFDNDIPLENFELVLIDSNDPLASITVDFNEPGDIIPANGCFVIANDLTQFVIDVNNTNVKQGPYLTFFGPWLPSVSITPPTPPGPPGITPPSASKGTWSNNYALFLRRRVGDPNDPNWIYVDRQLIIPSWAGPSQERYFGRDTRDWHVVYQTLVEDTNSYTLGTANNIYLDESWGHHFSFFLPNPLTPIQGFVTVGDIPRILTIGHGTEPDNTIGELLWETQQLELVTVQDQEHLVRLNLQDPNYSNIFQYLTVFDPTIDGIDNNGDGLGIDTDVDPNELKIPGRVNINTAPWYVIAQLPWVSYHTPNYELARAIVAYRDKLNTPVVNYSNSTGRFDATDIDNIREVPGFASIGELATVINIAGEVDYDMRYYALDFNDLEIFPDLTPDDGIVNDFEERDVIFSRISNLVTVRSDVFTAYILVRIGTDGPQKRAIAILDRSDVYPIANYPSTTGRMKVRAIHPVPDPR